MYMYLDMYLYMYIYLHMYLYIYIYLGMYSKNTAMQEGRGAERNGEERGLPPGPAQALF